MRKPITIAINLPALNDKAAVQIYNFLANLVDQFDLHYGEQIERFYRDRDTPKPAHRSPSCDADDPF